MAKAQAPPIIVTAFGKHPAWADHIDNLPNPGPRLPQFKSLLYTNGIDPNVRRWTRQPTPDAEDDVHSPVLDSDQQDPAAGLIRFDHRFRWWNPDALIVGKLIPSSDLKGRKKYPLVLAVQCVGVEPEWVRQHAWPVLDPLGRACREAGSVDAVRALLAHAEQALNDTRSGHAETALPGGGSQLAHAAVPVGLDALRALADHFTESAQDQTDRHTDNTPTDGPAPPIRLLRLLYQLQRTTRSAPRSADWPGTHLRVPTLTDDHLADLTLYQHAARYMTDGRVAVLAVAPDGCNWIDLILGHPDPSHFHCLRRDNLPHCTEIAYNLDEDEIRAIRDILRGAPPLPPIKEAGSGIFNLGGDRNKPDSPKLKTGEGPEPKADFRDSDPTPPSRRPTGDQHIKIMLWSIGALLLIIIALIVGLFSGF